MADNVDITAGSGTTIGTDERSVGGNTVQIQRVDEQGGQTIDADDISVTTAGTSVAARDTRKYITILAAPENTDKIFVGGSDVDAATPANGIRLDPGASITLYTTAQVYLDATAGTQIAYYIEVYD